MGTKTTRDNFIAPALPVLQRLEQAGYEAYLVGGCVREALRAELTNPETSPCSSGETGFEAAKKEISDLQPASLTDIDVTTNALPEEICRVFSDLTVVETGIKHGTVTVLVPIHDTLSSCGEEGDAAASRRIPIEITTYRVDGNYSDGRHPDQVRFVASLREDLQRRDFTVNALAVDMRGELADPFGGRKDLAAGIIRAVGDPETRFREDGLRILRALRFAAVLTMDNRALTADAEGVMGFDAKPTPDARALTPDDTQPLGRTVGFRIEPETGAALFSCAHLLEGISAERIFVELKKLVCGPAAGDVIRRYSDILSVVIPEMAPMKGFDQHNPYHNYEVLEHCIRAMEVIRPVPAAVDGCGGSSEKAAAASADAIAAEPASDAVPDAAPDPASIPAPLDCMKLAALLHDIGKPSTYSMDEQGIGHFYGHSRAGSVIVERVLRRLKADRWTIDRITTLVHYHDLVFQEDERLLKRWMNRYTPQILLEILELKRADNIATGNVSRELLDKFDRIESEILRIKEEHDKGQACFCVKDLAVNGCDLIEAGIPEGPQIGVILQRLLDDVIEGDLVNEREVLLDSLKTQE